MSVKVEGWVWDQTMPPSEKIVLLRLADHASPDGGEVYPSVASVAQYTGISERQVQRYIKSFVERGILIITAHEKGGRNNPREYRFTFHFEPKKGDIITSPFTESKGDIHDTLSDPVKGDIQEQERVTYETERVTPMTQKGDIAVSPEPSLTVIEPLDTQIEDSKPTRKPRKLEPDEILVQVWADECNGGVWPVQAGVARRKAKELIEGNFDVDEARQLIAWLRRQKWITGGITLKLMSSQADDFRAAKQDGKTVNRHADSKSGQVYG